MFGRTPAASIAHPRADSLFTQYRNLPRLSLSASCLAVLLLVGCSSLTGKKNSDVAEDSGIAKLLAVPELPDLIREAGAPRGLNAIPIRGVGLVNSLSGTGGPADPSSYLDQLIEEMRHNDVKSPNQILELDSNAMVRIIATVPPGAKRGDRIDLKIEAPPGSNASDLHGGWLLDSRMRLQQMIQGRVRKGEVLAMGTGSVLTRFALEGGADDRQKTQGLVLGGGTVQKTRNMGFVLRPEYQHVKVASDIAAAINRRFFFFDGTTRRGVAKAVEDDYIELELHPRYEGALGRYVAVVRAIMIDERKANSQQRLQKLGELLSDPATASDAALQLEALGESAIPTLLAETKSDNPELQFYAAEALAYLDRDESVAVLEQAASEPAFRYSVFAALGGLEHPSVVDALQRLFDQPSQETRYGAFVALRKRNDASRVLIPQPIEKTLNYYQVESDSPTAIALSSRDVAEVVVFGEPSPVKIDGALLGPNALILKPDSSEAGKIRVSRFEVGKQDRRATVPASIRGIIEGVVAVGGSYGDVVTILRMAKSSNYIEDQVAIDPLPKPMRTYYREEQSS
ncbi:flagellar basal body P-ring protein FlgI [Stieleria sp. TO1_6]|uniref:flagellar basal body P-ring protein FlgI n=1 Tax=Stieleria tagensis TaxID=2956795 RepID=UPI00209AECCF|nr:flagellar basal body P-ring protein FlgI [Stieleria tagensis]MCO8121969.1 flagellar basal body P-ring protein FlgI [Stieleria tagensis]